MGFSLELGETQCEQRVIVTGKQRAAFLIAEEEGGKVSLRRIIFGVGHVGGWRCWHKNTSLHTYLAICLVRK